MDNITDNIVNNLKLQWRSIEEIIKPNMNPYKTYYEDKLKEWEALPFYKKWFTKKPIKP